MSARELELQKRLGALEIRACCSWINDSLIQAGELLTQVVTDENLSRESVAFKVDAIRCNLEHAKDFLVPGFRQACDEARAAAGAGKSVVFQEEAGK